MPMLKNILAYTLLGNTVKTYLFVFLLLLGAGICAKIFSLFIVSYIKKVTNKMGKESVGIISDAATRSFILIIYLVAISMSLNLLVVTAEIKKILDTILQLCAGIVVAYFIFKIVDVSFAFLAEKASKTKTKLDDALLPILAKSVKIFLLLIIVLFVLNNMGFNVASVIAGLGVGGIAVALASQDTIKIFFGSIVLFADRPFNIGDRVIVEGVDGPVEYIGFRSTRIRTLDGTLVTIPNSKMADAIINNINKRPTRKTMMEIGVTYDTSVEKMRRGLEIVRTIAEKHPSTDNSIVNWKDYGPYSLNILFIHWCKYLEYDRYLQAMEEINFSIKEAFEKETINFAFPSQSIYMEKST